MKKLVFLIAISLAFSTTAFAAESDFSSSGTLGSTETLSVQLSNNVKMDYNGDSTNNGDSYAVAAGHDKGTKTYGSSSGDAKIFENSTLWTAAPTAPSTNTASADFSGWSAL